MGLAGGAGSTVSGPKLAVEDKFEVDGVGPRLETYVSGKLGASKFIHLLNSHTKITQA